MYGGMSSAPQNQSTSISTTELPIPPEPSLHNTFPPADVKEVRCLCALSGTLTSQVLPGAARPAGGALSGHAQRGA